MSNNELNPNRDNWVDYCKAIGIILVVYGHVARGVFYAGLPINETFFKVVDKIIYSFHMPMFFIISGLYFHHTLSKRKLPGFIGRKLDFIFYPYILWSIIQGFVEVNLVQFTNGEASYSEVFSFLWQPRAQFWFLFALFYISIFVAMVFSMISVNLKNISVAVLMGACVYLASGYIFEPPQFLFFLEYIVFYLMGVAFAILNIENLLRSKKSLVVLLSAFLLFHSIIFLVLDQSYLNIKVVGLFAAVLGSLFVVVLSLHLANLPNKWVDFIGQSTLAIYLLHVLAGSGIRIVMEFYLGITSVTVHLVIGLLFGLICPIIFIYLVDFYKIPWVFKAPFSRTIIKISN